VQRALLEIGEDSAYRHTTLALLDIGAASTDVTIVTHGYFALTRNIPIAGDQFTNAIKNACNITFEEAEERKMGVDMTSLLTPEGDADHLQQARMIQPTLDELLREVRRSVNYYQSQVAEGSLMLPIDPRAADQAIQDGVQDGQARRSPAGGQVSRLVITGGSAMLKGLQAYMEVRLGTPVEHGNIFDLPAFDSTQLAPGFIDAHHSIFALSTGLAVKRLASPVKVEDVKKSKSLLTVEPKPHEVESVSKAA
jgi:type IV pilus assembly protein PilM